MQSDQGLMLIRKELYLEATRGAIDSPDLYARSWKLDPYTKLKSYLYMELASIVVFLAIKFGVKPNTITLFYAHAGTVALFCLVWFGEVFLIWGCLIFFLKTSLDWADGFLARKLGCTSKGGQTLDVWGGSTNRISLLLFVGYAMFLQTGFSYFLFITIAILLLSFMASKLSEISLGYLGKRRARAQRKPYKETLLYQIARSIYFDGRSRYTDFLIALTLAHDFHIAFGFLISILLFVTLIIDMVKLALDQVRLTTI